MPRVIVGAVAALIAFMPVSGHAADRCGALLADIAVLDTRLAVIADRREKSWPEAYALAAEVQAEQKANVTDTAAQIWFCATLASRIALSDGEMLLLVKRMDISDDLHSGCPGQADFSDSLDQQASDAMDRVYDGLELLKGWRKRHCADSASK